jgi:hypothetical protein
MKLRNSLELLKSTCSQARRKRCTFQEQNWVEDYAILGLRARIYAYNLVKFLKDLRCI